MAQFGLWRVGEDGSFSGLCCHGDWEVAGVDFSLHLFAVRLRTTKPRDSVQAETSPQTWDQVIKLVTAHS